MQEPELRSAIIIAILAIAKDLTFSLPSLYNRNKVKPLVLAGRPGKIAIKPTPGIRLARVHCSLLPLEQTTASIGMYYLWRWYYNFGQSAYSTLHIAWSILLNGSGLFLLYGRLSL